MQYAGLTTRPAHKRFAEHLASTTDPLTTSTVGQHWQQNPGHRRDEMEFIPVEKLRGSKDAATLRQREKDLINRLDLIRYGLNLNL